MLTSTGDCVKGFGILEIGQTLQRLLVFKEVSVAIAIAWHVHNFIIYYMTTPVYIYLGVCCNGHLFW